MVEGTLEDALRAATQAAPLLERIGDVRGLSRLWDSIAYTALECGAVAEARTLIDRALAYLDRGAGPVEVVYVLGNAALVALESGDRTLARDRFREVVTRAQDLGIRRPVPEALLGLALLAAQSGEGKRAGHLAGAATRLGAESPAEPLTDRMRVAVNEAGRRLLGEECWRRTVNHGTTLGLEAVHMLAVDDTP
jgi:hypothetical protein